MAAAAVGLVAAGAASPSFLAGGKRSFDFLRYSEQVVSAGDRDETDFLTD